MHEGLVLDGGQSAQASLSATTVVGPLDPDDDRDPYLFSSPPPLSIQDVLLEQREEGLHRRVVPGNADFPHRSDEVMPVQRVHELPRPELGEFNWWTQHLRSRRVLMGRPAGWLNLDPPVGWVGRDSQVLLWPAIMGLV